MANASRVAVWLIGLLAVLAAVYFLWSTTGLSEIVPEGILIAVVLLILGIGVMGAASQIRGGYARSTREVVSDRPVGGYRTTTTLPERRVEETRIEDDRLP